MEFFYLRGSSSENFGSLRTVPQNPGFALATRNIGSSRTKVEERRISSIYNDDNDVFPISNRISKKKY